MPQDFEAKITTTFKKIIGSWEQIILTLPAVGKILYRIFPY